MRPMFKLTAVFALAAVAALTITLSAAPGDPAPLPQHVVHNADSTYRPEISFFATAKMQNVINGVF